MKKPLKIAVIGGTGKAGTYVVKALLEEGYQINVLARNPEKFAHRSSLMEIITGSARNFATMQRLLTGCTAVISTLGPSRNEPDTVSVSVGNIIRVSRQLNIERYIEIAGLAIDTPDDRKRMQTRMISSILRLLFATVVNDRQKTYQLLTGTQLKWTIVRCPKIELTDARRNLKTSLEDSPGNKISASDLAAFLISQLTDEKYIGKCPFVAS